MRMFYPPAAKGDQHLQTRLVLLSADCRVISFLMYSTEYRQGCFSVSLGILNGCCCRFLFEPEVRGRQAEPSPSAHRRLRPRGEALRCLWPAGGQEASKEMHMLHVQGQGVCVLLPPGHHLDQHTRVSHNLTCPRWNHSVLMYLHPCEPGSSTALGREPYAIPNIWVMQSRKSWAAF